MTRDEATARLSKVPVVTVGDFLDKPLSQGGLDLGRDMATLVLVAGIALCLWRIPQCAAETAH